MKHRCFQVEELGELLDLPESDPRQQHIETCPRCRALLTEYKAFMAEPQEMQGADSETAKVRLGEALAREIRGVKGAGGGNGGTDGTPDEDQTEAPPLLLKTVIDSRAFRLSMAAAAAILVILVAYALLDHRPPEMEEPVLREEPGTEGPESSGDLELHPIQPLSGNTIRLSWKGIEEADAYEVLLFSAELEALDVLGPVNDTFITLIPGEVPGLSESGTVIIWRVRALSEGDGIALSSPGTYRLP